MRTRTNYNFLLFLLFLFPNLIGLIGCSAQKSLKEKYSLLTWEYKREGEGVVPISNAIVLVKYMYSDTGYIRRELFQTEPNFPNYSTSEAKIYDDRFIINARGDIFDLEKNKVVHDHIGSDHFVEKSGDSVLFKHTSYTPESPFHNDTARHKAIKTLFYFFNLRTGEIVQLKTAPRPWSDRGGLLSPNKQMLAYFIPSDAPPDIDFVKDRSLMLCGWTRTFRQTGDVFVKFMNNDSIKVLHVTEMYFSIRKVWSDPMVWLNDHELIIQKKNGSLVKVNVLSNISTDYPVIENTTPCVFPSRLEKDIKNNIIYYCSTGANGGIFKVNTVTNSTEPLSKIAISEHYSVKPYGGFHPADYEFVKGYYDGDNTITTDTTTTFHYSITPEELIAIQCKEIIPSRNQYDHWNTIRIYDPSEKKWANITIEYLAKFVGWVKEH